MARLVVSIDTRPGEDLTAAEVGAIVARLAGDLRRRTWEEKTEFPLFSIPAGRPVGKATYYPAPADPATTKGRWT